MATYLMFGKYTPPSLKEASAWRTEEALSLIKRLGGQVDGVYAMLGPIDLVFIVDFSGTMEAMQASLALSRMTGIGFSTAPAVKVEAFDKLVMER